MAVDGRLWGLGVATCSVPAQASQLE